MSVPLNFLIAGGTGRQGGAVINALIGNSVSPVVPGNIYAISRNASGSAATRLAARGVNVISGNLAEAQQIFQFLKDRGVDPRTTAAFLAQAHGPTEVSDAERFIDSAVAAGLPYFVYSSVDRGGKEISDHEPTFCKVFSDKFEIEKYLRSAASASAGSTSGKSVMDYTILRPVWFADNARWGFPGRLCMAAWRGPMQGKRMQVVTTKDIGRWAVEALLRPDAMMLRNEAVSIASEELSFDDMDEIFRQETGAPVAVTYQWVVSLLVFFMPDTGNMFRWIHEKEYGADLGWLAQRMRPTTVRQWVRESVIAGEQA